MSANLQPEAVDLEQLDLTELQVAVKIYQNLFYHRTVILEGIRKIASRNMNHLDNAKMRYGSARIHSNNNWIQCVQKIMLHDQGLEDHPYTYTLLGWATFSPLWVYLALLYAEIEYYQKSCRTSSILSDDVFSAYIDSKAEWISALKGFRNGVLHPSERPYTSELDFLSCQESYNLAPTFQRIFDAYLYRIRVKMVNLLMNILRALPEDQKAACRMLFIDMNFHRMELHRDLQGMEHALNQQEKLFKQLEEDDISPWSPTPKQRQTGAILAECLNVVSPSSPEQQHTFENEEEQSPMYVSVLLPLLEGKRPQFYGDSRHAVHIAKYIGFYNRMIITAAVLLNEVIQGQLRQIRGNMRGQSEADFQETVCTMHEVVGIKVNEILDMGLQRANELLAPGRLVVATLHEPLRVYLNVVKDNPSVSNPKLDKWATPSRLKILSKFRNSVFHVIDRPDEDDSAMASHIREVDNLYCGLSEFFGVNARDRLA